MLFNSYQFLFAYFPIVLAGFFWAAKRNQIFGPLWLGLASLVFYGYWNPRFVLLLLASIAFNYFSGYAISRHRARSPHRSKALLTFAVLCNLALLAYFKYANFFIQTAGMLAGQSIPLVNVVLPLGISFFTFTQITFLVDAHRGISEEYNPIHYLLFVTYFPHLIAGPVLHHKQMMPQFGRIETYRLSWDCVSAGLTIFILGLAKKVLIADTMALGASPLFKMAAAGGTPALIEAWSGVLCYTMQIYFDFSGYSDMAIGLSLCFGVTLPINFCSPYQATSIIEFWRRWHITLSQFLRDYLYIPLGGNRHGTVRRYANVFVTMLLGGIWHGAGWNFLIWGAIHGILIIANQIWRHRANLSFPHGLGWSLTFIFVVFAWVPFRASDFTTTLNIWAGMCGFHGLSLPPIAVDHFVRLQMIGSEAWLSPKGLGLTVNLWISACALPFALFLATRMPNTQSITGYCPDGAVARYWTPSPLVAVTVGFLFSACLLRLNDVSEFLYFQF